MQRTVDRLAAPCAGGLLALALLLGAGLGTPRMAHAQSPMAQVIDLNRQAMEAFMMLELEQAQGLLQQALDLAESSNVTGNALARTYLNLGMVAVGGFADNGRGLTYFTQAIQADANIQLDPLSSTPEITTVFALAQRRAGSGGQTGGGQTGGGQTGGGQTGGGQTGGGASGNLPHMPVPEQLAQTAVPVYIEVPNDPAHVYLFYRAQGMREYNRVEMQSVAGGYGFEIPCSDVFQPSIDYYIVAFDQEGGPMGFAGSQSDPVSVQIVGSRTQPAPALPGRAPPETCSDRECPPGMDGCGSSGGGGMGASCRSDSDCGDGLSCDDDLCIADGGSDSGGDSDDNGMPRFFLHVGGSLGLGVATAGMQADTCPPSVDSAARDPNSPTFDPALAAACGGPPFGDESAYVAGGTGECGLESGQYCVRVAQGGVVPTGGIRVAAGGYFLPFLGVAAFARFQPGSGHGDLSFFLIGARLELQLTEPAETGVHAHVFAGFSIGQLQIQPPGNGDNAPYIISGLNGVPVGAIVGYRFLKHFGIIAQVDLMFQFPTFMYNTDITVGIETGF